MKAMVSGIVASPMTAFQPNALASSGASSAARTVPELPMPAMPIALPWCSGGYQRDASGSATAKLAPAKPRTTPTASVPPKLATPRNHDTSSPTMTMTCATAPVRFGPTRSTATP